MQRLEIKTKWFVRRSQTNINKMINKDYIDGCSILNGAKYFAEVDYKIILYINRILGILT